MKDIFKVIWKLFGVRMGAWLGVAVLGILAGVLYACDASFLRVPYVICCMIWGLYVLAKGLESHQIQKCWKESNTLLKHPDISKSPNRGDSPLRVKIQTLYNKLLRLWGKESLQGEYLQGVMAERHSTFEIRIKVIQRAFYPEKIIEQHIEPSTSHFTPKDFDRR